MFNYYDLKFEAQSRHKFWEKFSLCGCRYDDERIKSIALAEKYNRIVRYLNNREAKEATKVLNKYKCKDNIPIPLEIKNKFSEQILKCINYIEEYYWGIIDEAERVACESFGDLDEVTRTIDSEKEMGDYLIVSEIDIWGRYKRFPKTYYTPEEVSFYGKFYACFEIIYIY